MKNSNNEGFDQHYNAQTAVDQDSLLIVGNRCRTTPTIKPRRTPPWTPSRRALGTPEAGALDPGYFSATNIAVMEARDIEPYIATGRVSHHPSWQAYFAQQPAPPPADASPKVKMAYKLKTAIGGAIYRLRKCTVEPVIGIIKEILGFRQFSLRGLWAAAGEWCLVCLAFNLKRLHTLTRAKCAYDYEVRSNAYAIVLRYPTGRKASRIGCSRMRSGGFVWANGRLRTRLKACSVPEPVLSDRLLGE